MDTRSLKKVLVRVTLFWMMTLLVIPGASTLIIMDALLRGENLVTVTQNMGDIMFLSTLILTFYTWNLARIWAYLALLVGVILFGLWAIDRFLPWREWLKVNGTNTTKWGI